MEIGAFLFPFSTPKSGELVTKAKCHLIFTAGVGMIGVKPVLILHENVRNAVCSEDREVQFCD